MTQLFVMATREHLEPAQEIVPHLFLGNYEIATSVSWLKRNKITHVLSILDEEERIARLTRILKLTAVDHKVIFIADDYKSPLRLYFEESVAFIRRAIISSANTSASSDQKSGDEKNEQGRVLVHCLFGISRSATIVAAYLIHEYGMNASQSIKFITLTRVVDPSNTFQIQLVRYAQRNHLEVKEKTIDADWGQLGALWELVFEFIFVPEELNDFFLVPKFDAKEIKRLMKLQTQIMKSVEMGLLATSKKDARRRAQE
jgi:atypical dual specificity phosphatase